MKCRFSHLLQVCELGRIFTTQTDWVDKSAESSCTDCDERTLSLLTKFFQINLADKRQKSCVAARLNPDEEMGWKMAERETVKVKRTYQMSERNGRKAQEKTKPWMQNSFYLSFLKRLLLRDYTIESLIVLCNSSWSIHNHVLRLQVRQKLFSTGISCATDWLWF